MSKQKTIVLTDEAYTAFLKLSDASGFPVATLIASHLEGVIDDVLVTVEAIKDGGGVLESLDLIDIRAKRVVQFRGYAAPSIHAG